MDGVFILRFCRNEYILNELLNSPATTNVSVVENVQSN